ncbi:hypothetical protein [Micromonospora sp. NPDC047074]|uniref:hypothetical protein n=1 Tax=Micromonospora sp. NPDC047074 TaxID=3154339 RepID=UPI0033F34201
MERSWLFARLTVAAGGCPDERVTELVRTVLPDLVAAVRRHDPRAGWFFDRPGGPGLSLGFHAGRSGLREVDRRLRAHPGPASVTSGLPDPYAVRDTARGGPLAQAGSELALAVLADGAVPADAELPVAVLHLGHLVDLVPAADRAAFLFLHWQDSSGSLTGAQRRDLVAQADAEAEKLVLAATHLAMTPGRAAAAHRYLNAVRDLTAQDCRSSGAPRTWLLAEHARLTQRRLGIGPAVDALAAMALRLAILRDGALVLSPPDPPVPPDGHPATPGATTRAKVPRQRAAAGARTTPREVPT